jgi:hypothetical protein
MQNRIQDKINQIFVNLSKFFLLPRIDFNQLDSMIENNHSNISLDSLNKNLVTLGYFPVGNNYLVSLFINSDKKIVSVATLTEPTLTSQNFGKRFGDIFV